MRKLLISSCLIVAFIATGNAQTEKGNLQFEAGTTPFSEGLTKAPNTGFALLSSNGSTFWSVGGEAGYFVQDQLALKLGAGYTDLDGEGTFSYKVGLKYYAGGIAPFQIDITGSTLKDYSFNGTTAETPDPLYLGLQGGYAFFLNDHVSIEPGIRYNISLNSDFSEDGFFEGRIGFVVFL